MNDPQSSSRIENIDASTLSAEQAGVLQKLMRGRGRIPTPYKIWLHSPQLAEHLQPLGTFLAKATSLTKREVEIVILTAAAHWNCNYVFSAHAREARAAGLPEDVIEGIRLRRESSLPAGRERTVIELAASCIDPLPAPDDLFQRSVRELGHAGVAELVALFGYFTSVSVAMKLYQVNDTDPVPVQS